MFRLLTGRQGIAQPFSEQMLPKFCELMKYREVQENFWFSAEPAGINNLPGAKTFETIFLCHTQPGQQFGRAVVQRLGFCCQLGYPDRPGEVRSLPDRGIGHSFSPEFRQKLI